VRALKVPEGKPDIVVFDEKLSRFFVRRFASGKVNYGVKYSIRGKSKKHTLGRAVAGNLQAMRLEASGILAKAHQGVDAVAEVKAAAEATARLKTLGQLVPEYLSVREKGDGKRWKPLRPKSLTGVQHFLSKSWAPLHGEPVETITRQQIKARLEEIADESGAVSANRAHAALSGFYGWAIDMDHHKGANPTADIKPFEETPRTRYLSEPELVDVWQECGDDDFGRATKLLMLTGCRREEIGGLEWGEALLFAKNPHCPNGQIELPAHRVKNKQEHIVPLSKPALAILQACERDRHESRRHVFGGAGLTSWHYGKQKLDKRIAERRIAEGRAPMEHWVIHDLRRSFVTQLNELGIAPSHIIESLVNHISGAAKNGVAGTYNRARYLKERQKALEHWGEVLTRQAGFAVPASQNEATEQSDELSSQVV